MAISLGTALTVAAVAGTAAAVTGTTLGIVSSVQQQKQAEANAEAEAQQQEYNKRMAEREAKQIENEIGENARRQREASEYLKAQQRALLGKSGVAMTSGSPLAILGETAAEEERKVQDIHYGGYRGVRSMEEQGKMYQYQAGVARASAPSRAGTALTIAGQGLSGIGKVASTAMNYGMSRYSLQNSGVWDKSLF